MSTKRFDLGNLRGDLFGGITAGIVALPLALAFGVQSGLGAAAGLYGAIALGIVAAMFGGTPIQISGPTGPMTVVSAAVIASAIARMGGSAEAALPVILGTFVLAGAVQIIMGFLKIGRAVNYIPYPVVSGFMSGIGVIIIFLQIFPMLGHPSPRRTLDVLHELGPVLGQVNYQAAGLALATVAVIYLFPLLTRKVPGTLVALLGASVVANLLDLDVRLIGDIQAIPKGLPIPRIDSFLNLGTADLAFIIVPAITLAALGSIDSLLTSVVADNITKTKHNSDRELVGQGFGNMAAGLIAGLPGAGATMRTVVNANSGGKTRLSGVIHGLLLLAVLLGAGRYAERIPLAVLAGILITVGIGIIDYKGLKHMFRVPRADAAIMILVLGLTVFVDLLQAVGYGMALACVLFMKRMSEVVGEGTTIAPFREMNREMPWDDEFTIPEAIADRVYIKRQVGPLFFGSAARFVSLIAALKEIDVLIVRMEHAPYLDQSGLYALEEAYHATTKRGVTMVFTGLSGQPLDRMRAINLVPGLIPEDHLFAGMDDCVTWLRSYAGDHARILERQKCF